MYLVQRNERRSSLTEEVTNQWNCVICGVEMNSFYETHNPQPVTNGSEDRCCSHCKQTVVIPTRLGLRTMAGSGMGSDSNNS